MLWIKLLLNKVLGKSFCAKNICLKHKILRTPPYHPELQPIETCWAVVKNQMARNCNFTMSNLLEQVDKAFDSVTTNTCSGVIKKVRKIEDKFWYEDVELEQY